MADNQTDVYIYRGALAVANEGHIYVVQIASNRLKIGRTTKPTKRIQDHMRTSRAHGLTPGAVWVSGPHVEYSRNERDLLNYCLAAAKLPKSPRPEYFALVFDRVVRAAKRLPMTRANVEEYERHVTAGVDALKRSLGWG